MKKSSRAGFSALELVIAIVLISILGTIAYPSLSRYTAVFRVQAAGREVYSALQEVRQQAISRGVRTRFEVVDTDSYRLQWDDAGTWRTIRGPIQLEARVSLTSSGGTMTFLPRGTVTPLSTVTVADTDYPEHDLAISVPITGLVRIRPAGAS